MTVKKPIPEPYGKDRRDEACERRSLAIKIAKNRLLSSSQSNIPQTESNGEEKKYSDTFCMNFTKGLQHNDYGVLESLNHYDLLVEGINRERDTFSTGQTGNKPNSWFEVNVKIADKSRFKCKKIIDGKLEKIDWRGWESPRAGHAYDLEGPDAEALCMAPAPRLESKELQVEMAEVYTLALLRDTPFTDISGDGKKQGYFITTEDAFDEISKMEWFTSQKPIDPLEAARRKARNAKDPAHAQSRFRGSAPFVKEGPYISQFLLAGSQSRRGPGGLAAKAIDGTDFSPKDGHIVYGTNVINQRIFVHQPGIDYMSEWHAWLDVQNGANVKGTDQFLERRRFITTPRDLATYVHFDELYQAYLNAAFLLADMKVPFDRGFPSGVRDDVKNDNIKRDSFATFGGPHLLGILTEVSTRALRAVRRQKFNYHRRPRPESMGWIATLSGNGQGEKLGNAETNAQTFMDGIPKRILDAINKRNEELVKDKNSRNVVCETANPKWLKNNFLLPMAFPEGSPMHPSYGAGHATVAGACVTILKAFFDLGTSKKPRLYKRSVFVPNSDGDNEANWGKKLIKLSGNDILGKDGAPVKRGKLTIEGELNKLAANIAIGRNMAGVHYYTDYYDSLRLGERVAVGILEEQMTNYPDRVSMTFRDFDGNDIEIKGAGDGSAMVLVNSKTAGIEWWNCSPSQISTS